MIFNTQTKDPYNNSFSGNFSGLVNPFCRKEPYSMIVVTQIELCCFVTFYPNWILITLAVNTTWLVNIGNANKFSKNKIDIFILSDQKITQIIIQDDGPGFPEDLIYKQKLGQPYIRSSNEKAGLGLGTFIGKTLLEKNYANIKFSNSKKSGGAKVEIRWINKDLRLV